MANETRSISTSGLTAPQWTAKVDGSLNMASRSTLGRLIVTSGTGAPNAITATLLFGTGFSLQDGATCLLVPAIANTGAVTLDIEGAGAVAVRDNDGVALAASTLVADRMYLLSYDGKSGNEFWRILTSLTVASASGVPPYLRLDFLAASATWTAAYDCYVRIWMAGGAGSGACYTNATARATGGSGAEMVVKDAYFIESGQQIDFSKGAGGAAISSSAASNGNNGTSSSLTGPNGLTMTAYYGEGGVYGSSGTLTPPSGGTGDHSSDTIDFAFAGEDAPAVSAQASSAGGCFGLTETPDTPSVYSTPGGAQSAREVLDQISSYIGGFGGPWLARGLFLSGVGNAATGGTSGAGSPGCGSGGSVYTSGTVSAGKGGDGFCVIEYTKEIT